MCIKIRLERTPKGGMQEIRFVINDLCLTDNEHHLAE
jgi:hypothetical protein